MSPTDIRTAEDTAATAVGLAAEGGASLPVVGRQRRGATTRDVLRMRRAQIGLGLTLAVVALAIIGPSIAPHSPTEFVAAPNAGPSSKALFGTDTLGRDVWSRLLCGGRSVLTLSLGATIVGVGLGLLVGLTAAYTRGTLDEILMRAADTVMAFPQIVLALLLLTVFGPSPFLIVLMVGLSHMPRVARVIRGAALQVVDRDFVLAAEAAGQRRRQIVFGELLPNVTSPLLAEAGLRFMYSVGLIAAIGFLGLGQPPPHVDWGIMINENRLSMAQQPWGVVLPVLAIALLAIGTNLITDAYARAFIRLDRDR